MTVVTHPIGGFFRINRPKNSVAATGKPAVTHNFSDDEFDNDEIEIKTLPKTAVPDAFCFFFDDFDDADEEFDDEDFDDEFDEDFEDISDAEFEDIGEIDESDFDDVPIPDEEFELDVDGIDPFDDFDPLEEPEGPVFDDDTDAPNEP